MRRSTPVTTNTAGAAATATANVLGHDGIVVAALRLLWSDPPFWGADDGDAVYVHGLMVERHHAGHRVGERLLDWASEQAGAAGRSWLRLDCAADNTALCDYYRSRGFTQVRTMPLSDGPLDVVLWQRPSTNSGPGHRPRVVDGLTLRVLGEAIGRASGLRSCRARSQEGARWQQ